MNASRFMDKQIMDLTSSSTTHQSEVSVSSPQPPMKQSSKDFIDLMNPPQNDDHHHHHHQNLYNTDNIIGDSSGGGDDNGIRKEEILPSYDFQPIRPIASSLDSSTIAGLGGGANATAYSKSNSNSTANSTAIPIRNYGSLDSIEPAKLMVEMDRNAFDVTILSEIDKTMKKHADNLLHILEGVSSRLTQLESRTRHVENSVDDLKLSVGNNHGSTDGKMRQLENILREVQTGVQVLKEKQEIVEAQLHLSKLQMSTGNQQQSETRNTGHMDTMQQGVSAPPQSHQQLQQEASGPPQSHQQLPPVTFPQSIPSVSVPPAVPPPSIPQQNLPPPTQLPNQFPQSQIPAIPQREPYYSPPGQTQEPPNPQYQAPPSQQPQPSAAPPPHHSYQVGPQPHYSQPSLLPQPQPQPSVGHPPEETPYPPSQTYPPSLRQSSSQPPSGAPLPQQFYGAPSHMFEPPSSRPSSGYSAGYGPPSGSTESYPYGGSPSQYGSNPTMKPQQLPSSAMSQSGGSGYPQLPTARILPHSLPTASGVGGGSGSSGTGNRVPLDDVVDKVTNMGFPREHVRATVRKLTENGQAVDLNIVLDKLMNDGEVQPERGWFGR